MPTLKSITIDGQKFELPESGEAPTTKYLKITNPTWVFESEEGVYEFTLTEQQCLENDIIEIYNDEPGGDDTDVYYVVVPNIKKPLKINFVGNVAINEIGFKGSIDAFFPRGIILGNSWSEASMLLNEEIFNALTTSNSPIFIQYINSGYDIIVDYPFASEI